MANLKRKPSSTRWPASIERISSDGVRARNDLEHEPLVSKRPSNLSRQVKECSGGLWRYIRMCQPKANVQLITRPYTSSVRCPSIVRRCGYREMHDKRDRLSRFCRTF